MGRSFNHRIDRVVTLLVSCVAIHASATGDPPRSGGAGDRAKAASPTACAIGQVNPAANPSTPATDYVLLNATEGVPYSVPPRIENGVVVGGFTLTGPPPTLAPLLGAIASWSVSSGALPGGPWGLFLDEATGGLSGIPLDVGQFTFTIRATAFAGACTYEQRYAMTVACPTMTISPSTAPNATEGVAYTTGTMTVSAGSNPYRWSIASGALPPGLAGC